jgi:ribonuclease J
LRAVGEEGVLAIVCDSTNALRPGSSRSESELRDSLTDLIGRYDGRVVVACFASNVARLRTISQAARAHDRDVALVGRSLWRMDKAARENGYLDDVPRFLTEDEAGYVPRDKICLICTGSQGEPRAALTRIARDDHPNVVLDEGDAVIFSSKIIPGNEKAISRLHNALIRLGVEVVTEEDHFVHVSGHPSRDELTRMYQMIRPRVAIPVHGEARHLLGHAELARQCQVQQALVIENGDMVRLDRAGGAVVDEIPVGRIASDGKSLLPLRGAVLRERARAGNNGAIVANIVLDGRGQAVASPQITLIGLAEANSAPAVRMREAVDDALDAMPGAARRDDDAVREVVRRVLRRCANEYFGKRPLIEIPLVRL